MRRISAWAVVLLTVVFTAAVGWSQAEIVVPRPGAQLRLNEVIEISLKGLTARDAESLVVQGWSHPVGRELEKRPITRCNGAHFVPVIVAGTMGDDQCAVVTWTNRAAGEATLRVRWNHVPEGFVAGDHMVQFEIFVEPSDAPLGRWGATGWYALDLNPRPAPPPPPPPEPELEAHLVAPTRGSEFEVGAQVPVEGRARNAAFPIHVELHVSSGGVAGPWHTVDRASLGEATYALVWDTESRLGDLEVKSGDYHMRVRVADADGKRTYTDSVRVALVDPPPPALHLLVSGEAVEEAKADARRPVQFGLRTEPAGEESYWASFAWDFGDGNTSREMHPQHAFQEAGTYTVCLTAWTEPDLGGEPTRACVELEISERPVLSVDREIWGYPVPQSEAMSVMPGFTVHVRLRVKTLDPAVGISVSERAPAGWEIEDVSVLDDPKLELLAAPRAVPDRITWVITSREPVIKTGTEFALEYTLHVPDATKLGQATLSGVAHARVDPRRQIDLPVSGDSELTVVLALPVCVAIAYLERPESNADLELRAPATGDTYLLGQPQVEIARELIEHEVPYTDGTVMTPEMYLRLRAYAEAEVPVTACTGE